jgi:predicted RNase H-like nuclease (RuvC/YqgF family)
MIDISKIISGSFFMVKDENSKAIVIICMETKLRSRAIIIMNSDPTQTSNFFRSANVVIKSVNNSFLLARC